MRLILIFFSVNTFLTVEAKVQDTMQGGGKSVKQHSFNERKCAAGRLQDIPIKVVRCWEKL